MYGETSEGAGGQCRVASVTEHVDQEWNLSARFDDVRDDACNVCMNRTPRRTTSEKSIRVLIQAFVLDANIPIRSEQERDQFAIVFESRLIRDYSYSNSRIKSY